MQTTCQQNWRSYFNLDELETAYTKIEVDKTEVEEQSDSGSESDPSADNLSETELLSKVYMLPAEKIQEYNRPIAVSGTQITSQVQFFNRINAVTRKDSAPLQVHPLQRPIVLSKH